MTNDDSLLGELKQAATPAPPKNFQPGVIYEGRVPSQITTPPLPAMDSEAEFVKAVRDLGYPLPEGYTLMLVEMQMAQHENFWTRENQGEDAVTKPSASWRYRFKVVPLSLRSDEDLAALMAEAKAAGPNRQGPYAGDQKLTRVVSLADFQVGKVDELGGTAELLARSEAALDEILDECYGYDEIVILDPGDSTEGFESAPNADRMNDLSQTEQIRVWRRILWRWIEALAPLAPEVKVVGVPSNHCRVRRGKNAMGDALDDWGIEVIAQVSDIAKANPEVYGHVQFVIPQEHQEHVLVTLIGGQVLGVVHGHQKSSPAQLPGWIKSTGRRGLAQADIVVAGHFHHLEVVAFGDQQTLFVCPTNDNGSSWFTPSSGERSRPGVLHFCVDDKGWRDLQVCWTA